MRIEGFRHNSPRDINPARKMLQERIKDLEDFCVGTSSKPSQLDVIKQRQQDAADKFREFGAMVRGLMNPNRTRAKGKRPSLAPKIKALPEKANRTNVSPKRVKRQVVPVNILPKNTTPIVLPPPMPPALPMKNPYINITPDMVLPKKLDIISGDIVREMNKPPLALPAPKETVSFVQDVAPIIQDTTAPIKQEIKTPAKKSFKDVFEKVPKFVQKHKKLSAAIIASIAAFGIFRAKAKRKDRKD